MSIYFNLEFRQQPVEEENLSPFIILLVFLLK